MRQDDETRRRSRSQAFVVGMRWASTATAISLEMALPPVAGIWLDERFGTTPLWMAVLAVLGMFTAMTHLIQLSKRLATPGSKAMKSNGNKKSPEDSRRGGTPS